MVRTKQNSSYETPEFINILSSEDKTAYEKLQNDVGSSRYRHNRHHRISTLEYIFKKIRDYCQERKEDEWKRYLVCGICWFDDYIAINTRQLRHLISKCKSSINDAFSKMGYITVSTKGEIEKLLHEKIPFLYGNQAEFRKWSVRKLKKPQINISGNKIINLENDFATDDDEEDDDEDRDDKKTETNNDFFLDDFCHHVDENFDFEFGYGQESFQSISFNNNNENDPIMNYHLMNYELNRYIKAF